MHSIPSIFSDSTALRESWAEVMPPFSPFFPTGRDFPSSTTTTTTTLARLSITFKEQTRDTRDTRVYFFEKFLALPHIFFFPFLLFLSPINTEGLKIIRFTIGGARS